MKNVKVLGLIATLLVFAYCISSCKQTGAGGIESSGKKEVTFSIEQKDLVTKSTKSATIKADAKFVVVSIANDAGLVYDTKRLDLYNFSGSFISEPISLDIATTPYKVTKFLVLDANNVVIYATPLEGSALAPMVDDPLPINFTVSKDKVTKVVPQVLATESIPVKDFGYVAFDFDVMASPLYFRTCVQIYNPATANWMLTTADISITGTPGDVALYNNPIGAITDIVRVSDSYTSYKISVSKTGYATKEIVLTNAQLKTYMENPLIVLLIEPGVVNTTKGLLLTWDNISNVPVANVSSVSDWNTFFDLPKYGNLFTSVAIEGNVVNLIGGSNIHIKDVLFSSIDGTHLVKIIDNIDCIISIGKGVFSESEYHPYTLTTAILPAVQTIDDGAFLSCKELEYADFTSLRTANDAVFMNCIKLNTDFPALENVGTCCFNLCVSLVNPNFALVTKISMQSFQYCTSLISEFPSLTIIAQQAFSNCNSFTNQRFPNVITIGKYAFWRCANLSEPKFPLVTTVGEHAFEDCAKYNTINLPSVTDLGGTVNEDYVFIDFSGSRTINLTVPAALMTCNNGQPDADIQYLQAHNTVTVIPKP